MKKVVLAFGYHNQGAPRHWNIKRMLEAEGFVVRECHTEKKGFFAKCRDLTRQFREKGADASVILVTFPGHFLVPLAWWLARYARNRGSPVVSSVEPGTPAAVKTAQRSEEHVLPAAVLAKRRPKLIFDAFISLWDSIIDDRRKFSKWNPYAWFLYGVDLLSCHLADEVLIDTQAHRKFFIKRFFLDPEKIFVVYVGSRTDIFTPGRKKEHVAGRGGRRDVLFYGTYIPLQGVEHIIDAAQILQEKNPDIHFTLVGSGQTFLKIKARAERVKLRNLTFVPRVPFEELPLMIRDADLTLGIFGKTAKAARVIPHKVFDSVACGVPIVTADTPAIHEKFDKEPLVILCRAGDPKDLAEKIVRALQR